MSRNVYVVVPGILGSVLEKDKKDAFGFSISTGLRALFTGGSNFDQLVLDPTLAEAPDDGVTAARLADVSLIPGFWKIDVYGPIRDYVQRRLGAVPGESYFEFPYDWRLDNRLAAHRLNALATRWLEAHQVRHPDAKLVLLAHSMGGLVSRYFLEVLGGWKKTHALVTFGTPYRGSLKALNALANGLRPLHGLIDLTGFVRSLPSVHQLLPTYRCVATNAAELSYVGDVAAKIDHLLPAAVDHARQFHTEIAEAAAANAKTEAYRTSGYQLHRVIGSEQPTLQSATLSAGRIKLLETYLDEDHGGDGTVPRVSASPPESEDDSAAMFSDTMHASLQNAVPVLVQLRAWMSGRDLTRFLDEQATSLSLRMSDEQSARDGVRFTVTPSDPIGPIDFTLEWLGGPGAGPAVPVTGKVPPTDGPREAETAPVLPGAYRLTLTAGPEIESVSDLLVAD